MKKRFIISAVNQKGGSGKSTTIYQLSGALLINSYSPLVILDLDPQGSLSATWQRRAADYPVEVVHKPGISIKDPIFNSTASILAVNPGLKLLWVFNQVKQNTIIFKDIQELAIKRGLPVARAYIPESVALVESIAKGLPLCYMLRNHIINQFYNQLIREIEKL